MQEIWKFILVETVLKRLRQKKKKKKKTADNNHNERLQLPAVCDSTIKLYYERNPSSNKITSPHIYKNTHTASKPFTVSL